MLKVTWRNLAARKVRLLLSAFAIVLGVAFVAGSLIFTGTMSRSFDNIVSGTVSDVNVRFKANSTTVSSGQTVDASVVKRIAAVDGVGSAIGDVQVTTVFVKKKDGKLLGGSGAPTLTYNWTDARNTQGDPIIKLTSGHTPRSSGEVVLDKKAAQAAGYRIGDTVSLVSAGDPPLITAKLVGEAEFTGGGVAGATLVMFSTATMQKLFFDGRDVYTGVSVETSPGVSESTVQSRVAKVLPDGVEAVTGTKLAKETKSLIDRLLGFFNTFLLVFAAIALVVGTFLIINTFSILVAQRSRELALLRAMGASKRQVMVSVLLEAVVVGLIGSTFGIVLGFGLAVALKALFSQYGLDLSGTPLVFRPSTAIVSYLVGILVTVVAAALPARRAASVSPVAAMREDVSVPETTMQLRMRVATGFAIAGAVLMGLGLWGDVPKRALVVGIGIFAVLMAVALAAPVLSRPVLDLFGQLYTRAGAIGRLATENARRNPARTAATASALMIGLALVTTMSILGSSVNRSIDAGVRDQFNTDFLISNVTGTPFSTTIANQVKAVDGVDDVARSQTVTAKIGGKIVYPSAVNYNQLSSIFRLKLSSGHLPTATDEIAMSKDQAKRLKLSVGQRARITLNDRVFMVRLTGLYPTNYVLNPVLVPLQLVQKAGIARQDSALAVVVDQSKSLAAVGRAIDKATAQYPTVTVQNKTDYADSQKSQVSTLLALIYALLGLAIVIAVLGIVNTLSLSVIERTREIGLLRAVGLAKAQLWLMMLLESVAIAVLGAVLGIAAGLLFGIALQQSLKGQGIDHLGVPLGQLVGFVILAAIVGVIAAVVPAWRASRLNILTAIATE